MANNKDYFIAIYKELASLPVMKAAFDWFASLDVSKFNYRAIPYSETKDKLAKCSEKNVTKFHRWLLRTELVGEATFDESDLYHNYKVFCEEYGVARVADRTYVCSQLELYMKLTKYGTTYILSEKERNRYFKEIKH